MIADILAAPIIPKVRKSNTFGSLRFAAVNAPKGPWAEFGVYRGHSARYLLTQLPKDGELHLFDSFEGLPEPWEDRHGEGAFRLPEHKRPRFDDARVSVHVGPFAVTLPRIMPQLQSLALAHVDCDVYGSTRDVLSHATFHPGAILVFNELYNYPGFHKHEYRALCEWQRAWGHDLRVLGRTLSRQVVVRLE